MKIPFGYGYCNIQFSWSTMPDEITKSVNFRIDHNSSYEIIELSDTWMSLARSNEKDIYGYHVEFDLKLIDYYLPSASTQDDLVNFLYYYNLSTAKDKRFYIYPFASGGNFWQWDDRFKVKYQVITTEYPRLTNISEHITKGQYLHLKCKTKFIIDKDAYNYLIYRDTSDGNWASLPTTTTVGSGEQPVGSV